MSKPYRDYTEQDIYNLIQENKQLKNKYEQLRKINKANADNYVRWRDRKEEETEKIFINGCQIHIWLLAKNKKLSQLLDEIAEIINDVGDDNYLLIREKILVKIDEVKEQ